MEHSLYKFIIKYSLRQQIILTILALTSFVPYYYYLSMPKTIVNQGIAGKDVTYPVNLFGLNIVSLNAESYLLVLCFGFLLLVIVQQCFKYVINVFQGISGERMLRRLRYELYCRVLRFPQPTFKKMSAGEIIPMITAEVEPLGGFIADSFALPIFQGGMLLTTFIFLIVQNPIMAIAAVSLYPFQFWVIPKLQRIVNRLGKERVKTARQLADRIHESISGVQEIHTHDASNRFKSEFTRRLGKIYWIRYEIFQRKFMIKFINNFLQQLGPFFFYSIGGYLVIKGQLDLGQVIAAVTAHKEMGAPWKELLNHYQQREDARIKYDQVVSQFAPEGMRDASDQTTEPDGPVSLAGEIQFTGVSYADETGAHVLENFSMTLDMPRHVALVGGSGREEIAQLMARLIDPMRGKVSIAGQNLAMLPESVTGRRLAYVGPAGYVFNSTIGDNLLFSLRHRALKPVERDAEAEKRFQREMLEARASGNSLEDYDADFTDYAAAGATDSETLREAMIRALKLVQLDEDIYQLGLRGSVDPARAPEAAASILEAREALKGKMHDDAYADLIEDWHVDRYNRNATVAENLMFGLPIGDKFAPDRLAENAYMLEVLEKAGLKDRFLAIGYDVASTMVELFADLPPDHEFFQQFSFISSEELPDYQEIVNQVSADKVDQLDAAKRNRLMSLPFKLIVARHRLGHIDDEFQEAVLKARALFAEGLPEKLRSAVAFFDPDQYTLGGSILDNILFGKIAYGQAQAAEKIGRLVRSLIDELDLRDIVIEVGLAYETGIAGARLSGAQRQKVVLARAILKKPDLIILNEAISGYDNVTQAQLLTALREEFAGRGLVWSLHNPHLADGFDRVVLIDHGKVVEQGSYEDLTREGRPLARMLAGN